MPGAYFYNQNGDLNLHEDERLAAKTANPAVGLVPEPEHMLTGTGGAEETPDPNQGGQKVAQYVPEMEEVEVHARRETEGVSPGPGLIESGMPRLRAVEEPELTPEVRKLVQELVQSGIARQLMVIEEGEP